ncbi:MAG TPA: OmpH family outer membrane protein [Rhodocyclaceae bacterium]|nr:OmpH family outer membrane protein [Rhodocyclaceae bacterium]
MLKLKQWALAGVIATVVAGGAMASELKVGYVNTQRLFRDAPVAIKAQKKLDAEFSKRNQELQKQAKNIQSLQESLEKDALTMAEKDRLVKERELGEQTRDFQRKQREFREDLNLRQNEEMAAVLERANKVIKQIAETEKYDLIVQDAVFVSQRLDVTEKVIKALVEAAPGK